METLRIALVTDWFFGIGGVEKHVQNLTDCLSKQGHEVEIITNHNHTHGYRYNHDFKIYRLRGIPLRKWNVTIGVRPLFELDKILRKQNYDILHAHSIFSPLSYIAIFVASRRKLPVLLTNHSLIGNSPLSDMIKTIIKKPISKTNAIIAVSRAVKKETETITKNPVFLIPNGIKADILNLSKENMRENGEILKIVSVARLTKRKQIIDLVDIANELKNYNIKFLVVGDGPEREKIYKKISRLKLKNFILMGQKSEKEVIDIMRASDIFVLPSTNEAFGIAALEARACGLPVIARDHSGVSDIITHGKNGFLADSKEEMVYYLKKLITQPELRKEFSMQAKIGIENYTWENITKKVLKTYKLVIENEKDSVNN